ncbi:hypothetical protein LVB77_18575 [Lysobacter sp. 5GHs7-4]|uniref:hypothetical protein n=1 Tax=Lysobacter sp. 5GHs7-4 TaxID=2904253 RepID=UPI001E4214C5|nr:hypothetical protein [Lysobacter sp. 5GHs7-4]UHQ22628.1 hypothetical protein LVB77_18575 [Lysobacter sp. 5GHs7-4]
MFAIALASLPAMAVDYRQEYEKRVKSATDIVALQVDSASGEKLSLYDGRLQFNTVDIDVPGNSALPVRLARSWKLDRQARNGPRAFDDWDLDVPYLSGIFTASKGWTMQFGERCGSASGLLANAPAYYAHMVEPQGDSAQAQGAYYVYFEPRLFWHGYSLHVDGGEQTLLVRHAGNPNGPSAAHTWSTQEGWAFSCIPADNGEGFLGLDTQGNKYYFNHVAALPYEPVHQAVANPYAPPCELGCDYPRYASPPLGPKLLRSQVRLLATRVEDRFGNWVAYDYDGAKLLRIRSNDGRQIDLAHDARGRVIQATAGGRIWLYGYQQVAAPASDKSDHVLKSVTLPDGSAWNYTLDRLGYAESVPMADDGWRTDELDCGQLGPEPDLFNGNEVFAASVVTPSGARYDYKARPTRHHLTYVTEAPVFGGVCLGGSAIPRLFDVVSVFERTVSGAGVPARTWSYAYQQPERKFRYECDAAPASCSDRKTVLITEPSGTVRKQYYGVKENANTGLLLGEEVWKDGALYRVTGQIYQETPAGQPYPALQGLTPTELGLYADGEWPGGRNRPLKQAWIDQDGVRFTRDTASFDRFARPTATSRYSTLGYSAAETTQYADDTGRWILGQVVRSTQDGVETTRADLDANLLPWRTYNHGQLLETLAYAADGTLLTSTDAKNRVTSFSQWKRGLPQRIQYPPTPEAPAGASQSAVVDDSGWITSTTDENGYTTAYSHDAMGRLATLTHPGGDSVDWLPTTQSFAVSPSAQHGLPAGHWLQTVTTGNARKTTHYDALRRPVVTVEQDLNDPAGTTRWSAQRYDEMGRVEFASYPINPYASGWKSYADATLAGVLTRYDALDRPVRRVQTSELGDLTTTIEYLSGLKRRTVNPRGVATVEAFQAFDQPGYDSVIRIDTAAGTADAVRTVIDRDNYGKAKEVSRGAGE